MYVGFLLPYFELRRLSLSEGFSIEVFGTLVVLGVAVGLWFARRRATATGIPSDEITAAATWALLWGFAIAHLVEVLVYRPEVLRAGQIWPLLEFWNGLSSFGGFFGALLGVALYFRRRKKPWLLHAEALLQGLVVGWLFGRLGCTLVHDHVGRLSSFALAIRFPGGARHDLGLYELLFTAAILVPALAILNSRPRAPGATVVAVALLYAPARLFLDFLRNTDLPTADVRFFGLTPAQYGCLVLFGIGLHFWRRVISNTVERQVNARRSPPG